MRAPAFFVFSEPAPEPTPQSVTRPTSGRLRAVANSRGLLCSSPTFPGSPGRVISVLLVGRAGGERDGERRGHRLRHEALMLAAADAVEAASPVAAVVDANDR